MPKFHVRVLQIREITLLRIQLHYIANIDIYYNYARACTIQNTTYVILIYKFYICFF